MKELNLSSKFRISDLSSHIILIPFEPRPNFGFNKTFFCGWPNFIKACSRSSKVFGSKKETLFSVIKLICLHSSALLDT